MQRLTIDVDSPEYAWLNLTKEDLVDLRRPLTPTSKNEKEDFHLKVLAAMKNPEYFQWTCKHLLNVDLLPTQVVILQELWNHNFPIYIASRGFGKAISLQGDVLTKSGWKKMKDIQLGDETYGRDGKLHKVIAIHPQGKKQICRLTLLDGRVLDCCKDHLWVVKRNDGKELTVDANHLVTTPITYLREDGTVKSYKYTIPNCEPIQFDKRQLPLDPYILGCLLGDGCLTTATPKIASNDMEIVDYFKTHLTGFKIEKDPTNNNWTIVDQDKDIITVNKKKGAHKAKAGNRLTTLLRSMKLNVGCKEKFIPEDYKFSSVEDRLNLVRGLLDTDGSINTSGSIEFTNTNERLVDDLIDVLRSLGITCKKEIDKREGQEMMLPQGTKFIRRPYFRVYINTSMPIFKLERKLSRIKPTGSEKYVPITKAEMIDEEVEMQCITVDAPDHTFIMNDYTVTHNSFLLAVYCLLRNIFIPDSKIVIVGAAFRQSKIIFDYMDNIWKKSPILHTICSDSSGPYRAVDRCEFKINGSVTIAVPLGNGDKIRGLRAHTIIADEFNSIPVEIYETVVSGFASVSKDPVENVKRAARKRHLMKIGKWSEQEERVYEESSLGNQTILSGTCGYDFEPFAKYWKKYHALVKYKGDLKAVANATGESIDDEETHSKLDYKSFCVIRIPYELIPEGFMDDQTVSRAKTTMHTSTYSREYAAVFPKDSQGFFKRSLIEACTASESNCNLPNWPYWCPQPFQVVTNGSRAKQYVFGIDPASEEDNFAISVLELHDEHQRCVYCWTTNKKDFQERKSMGMTDANDYYSFCCRKIRELMRVFPCVRIAIDSQGGGYAVAEGLADTDKLLQGERPILPIIEEGVEKPTDTMPGEHILEFISFADATWTSQANHGLRKDMEDKVLLFPQFDVVALAVISERDKIQFESLKQKYGTNNAVRLFDTLEDAYMEIQELKEELSLITVTRTESGRERFSTPEVKLGTGKKGRMRKDRYSALLMANMVARTLFRTPPAPSYINIGRISGQVDTVGDGKAYASGPDFMKGVNTNCFKAIKKS